MKISTLERKWKSNIREIRYAHIVGEPELMIQKIFIFAQSVKVRVLLWKLKDLDQASSNNFKHNVINAEVRAKP